MEHVSDPVLPEKLISVLLVYCASCPIVFITCAVVPFEWSNQAVSQCWLVLGLCSQLPWMILMRLFNLAVLSI